MNDDKKAQLADTIAAAAALALLAGAVFLIYEGSRFLMERPRLPPAADRINYTDALKMPQQSYAEDPCGMLEDGGLFYNRADNYYCFCDGTRGVKYHDPAEACFVVRMDDTEPLHIGDPSFMIKNGLYVSEGRCASYHCNPSDGFCDVYVERCARGAHE